MKKPAKRPSRAKPAANAVPVPTSEPLSVYMSDNRRLLEQAFNDWMAAVLYTPQTASEDLKIRAEFAEARMRGDHAQYGVDQAGYLIDYVKARESW